MKPGAHTHVPWLHIPLGPQGWLQLPQCALFVLGLMHVPLQQIWPGGQHRPPLGPQGTRPGGQAHVPLIHCLPPVHASPHAEQFAIVPSLVGVQLQHLNPVGTFGALAFPNAVIHVSIPEWTAMQGYAPQADMVRAITPKVRPFAGGAQVTPSIRAVSLDGHTPGHSGYEITSGDSRLLYIGDALHSSIISVQRPDWRNMWDDDSAEAIATRQALLERGASQNLLIYGVHFPFPGLGRFQRKDDGFVWVPETPAQP